MHAVTDKMADADSLFTLFGSGIHTVGAGLSLRPDGTLTYKQVEVDAGRTRVFPERYYAFAIPESERSTNPALNNENNPGW